MPYMAHNMIIHNPSVLDMGRSKVYIMLLFLFINNILSEKLRLFTKKKERA